MACAEVVKDKPATVDEEGDFRLQKKPPNFLIKKFELSENLPTVSATMEQPSPVSVLNNTAFEDEELIPSPQSCTMLGINLEGTHLKTYIQCLATFNSQYKNHWKGVCQLSNLAPKQTVNFRNKWWVSATNL